MTLETQKIKVLVLDIDGTLIGETRKISPSVKQAIDQVKKQGISVVLATGRMYRSAKIFHELFQLNTPIIAYNGAWIHDTIAEQRLFHLPVSLDITSFLLDELEQLVKTEKIQIQFYIEDQLYVRKLTPETEIYRQRSGIQATAIENLRSLLPATPTKILMIGQDYDFIAQLQQDIRSKYSTDQLYCTHTFPEYLEVTHHQVNKGKALQYLTENIWGLNPDHIMVIGDGWNDLEMLQYSGISIAMGDAPQGVKDVATWVTSSVAEDGVAIAINRFLLQ
jgi:Cof subfamily protein (haloacid dehalogenase superfamily)